MALKDLEAFLQERLLAYDERLDLSSGSPLDTQVIQPTLRRLGTDPFTTDAATFIQERLTQEFPELQSKEGDAITDLLIKPLLLLWDPLIREIQRVKRMLSIRNADSFTTDEAEALGANFFAERDGGEKTRGVARVYFAQPQKASISPSNFFVSKGGLVFFPTTVQSIKAEEMLFNTEGSLYYFDVTVSAESAGDAYNIEADELITIANFPSAARVTNKLRYRSGRSEETSVQFLGRVGTEITEKSLVTLPGIASKTAVAFPDARRLAVVGFNDPEMQRDVLKGGGLGPIIAFGTAVGHPMQPTVDGLNKTTTRRITAPAFTGDFTTLIAPTGVEVSGVYITLVDAFVVASPVPVIQDLEVARVIDSKTLEVADSVIKYTASNITWMLRRKTLTLSDIPGGIIFPDNVTGTVEVADDQVHIGGATDIHVRGTTLDTSTLQLSDITDSTPLLSGTKLNCATGIATIDDLVLGTDYFTGDATWQKLEDAKTYGYTLQIREGAAAGSYRILEVTHGGSVQLTTDPVVPTIASQYRWYLFDIIDIDLVEPREELISGADGVTILGANYFMTSGGIDFDSYGVAPGDILRIKNGMDKGDFTVLSVATPLYNKLNLDRTFQRTAATISYEVFHPNTAGGVLRPIVRLDSIDLLDSSGSPTGSVVPFACPVDGRSTSFANGGRGVKVDTNDAILGLVGESVTVPFTDIGGLSLNISWDTVGGTTNIPITFAGGTTTLTSVVAQIIASMGPGSAMVVGTNRLAIAVQGANTRLALGAGPTTTSVNVLNRVFGDIQLRTSRDIRSATAFWHFVTPAIDQHMDVVNVMDGNQVGYYGNVTLGNTAVATPLVLSLALLTEHDFAPELERRVHVGARSLGTARMYFREPTSFEVDYTSKFTTQLADGSELHFYPDYTLEAQVLPPLPSGAKSTTGVTTIGTGRVDDASTDFLKKGVRVGDILELDFTYIRGSVALTDPVVALALTTLVFSLDEGADKTIIFRGDTPTPGQVNRDSIPKQINQAAGMTICSIVKVGPNYYLQFEPSVALTIRKSGTANTLLGFSTVTDTDNEIVDDKGRYTITAVAPGGVVTRLTTSATFNHTATNLQFKVLRPGAQRIGTTTMSRNVAETGLYYFDVELYSEGTGDTWNIPAGLRMTVKDFISDGYYLTTDDDRLSFSPAEGIHMHISRSIREVGTDDDPENATLLSGQNLRLNYSYSTLVEDLQAFTMSEDNRVVNESPLARHLVPHFVSFDLTYSGGSQPAEILPDLEEYINNRLPADAIEASDIQKILSDRGAQYVANPLVLLAEVHPVDRTVYLERSNDRLTTGRLAAFIPDRINLTRTT